MGKFDQTIGSLADLGGGGVRDARPPWASKFFRFHAVFGKIWRVHAPPGGFTPPPRENPGSATEVGPHPAPVAGLAPPDIWKIQDASLQCN